MNNIPKCRLCGADEDLQFIKGHHVCGGTKEHHFWQCKKCGAIYLYPIPSEEEESQFYRKEFEKYMAVRSKQTGWSGPQKHVEMNQREVDRRLPFLDKFPRGGMKILEIGCSSGFMLYPLQKRGHYTVGVEPSEEFRNFIASNKIEVYPSVDELALHNKDFDMAIHYYLLEHIRNPEDFLKKCMALVASSGIMIFEVPSASDALLELYHVPAFDKFYWQIIHHWYFTKESLSFLLDKIGYNYEIYPEQRYDLSNHITWMLTGEVGGLGKYTHIFGQELEQKYKEALKQHWYCDTLIAVVKKTTINVKTRGVF
jgi:SAM-dependent methyltransferase